MTHATIRLASGASIDLLHPEQAHFDIQDIAHALSHLCRFGGHTRQFYSVAQHSYLCSLIVPPEDALSALLHDATEAYIGDMVRPLKSILPEYQEIEGALHRAIFRSFKLEEDLPASVKHADLVLLATEKRDVMLAAHEHWPVLTGIEPLRETIHPVRPYAARKTFLKRFHDLWSDMFVRSSGTAG